MVVALQARHTEEHLQWQGETADAATNGSNHGRN
jgi:hypothetical protein